MLEVAVGDRPEPTAYPPGVRYVGIDLTPAMLAVARDRAHHLGIDVDPLVSNAQALPFVDGSFDTVVCTLALNAIPDNRAAIAEMYRVLRPSGRLLLLGHVSSDHRVMRVVQRLLEKKSVPIAGDHQIREPLPILVDIGFTIERQARSKAGRHPTHCRGQAGHVVTGIGGKGLSVAPWINSRRRSYRRAAAWHTRT